MKDETKRRVTRILEESAEDLAKQQQEKARELEATRRFRFGVMFGLCAVFMLAFAAFIRPSHPRDAAIILLLALVALFIAGFYVDRGTALLRQIAGNLRRRWGREADRS